MPHSIKPLRVTDAKAVRDIFREVFDECEDGHYAEAWRKRARNYSLGYFSKDGDLLAFALVAHTRYSYYLSYIAVHPEYQGQAIGSELLHAVLLKLQAARQSLSLIPADNPKTINWYSKKGFYVSHTWTTRDGIHALYMTRHFDNTRNCPSL